MVNENSCFIRSYDAEEREAQSDGEDDDELNGNDSEDDGGEL